MTSVNLNFPSPLDYVPAPALCPLSAVLGIAVRKKRRLWDVLVDSEEFL